MKILTNKISLIVVIGALLGEAAVATAPEPGWQKVIARKGGCMMYVPADWKVDALIKGSAGAADQSASAVVSLADATSTLAQVKPVIQGIYKPTKTFEDSTQRLWYEYQANNRPSWYVGVPVKGGICGAQIVFKPGKEAIANKIAASVGAGS
jgi:hypothetical protein